jgi:hypothetical protein
MKYRKKPVVIEAYQTDKELDIETLEGTMHASVGDYIITGVRGEKYPCKPDIFEQTYEPADVPTASPWHRAEERPDEHTNLWLHDERGNYHVGCISTYRGYTEYIDMGGNTLHDIDYWMPIEPPKE